MANTPDNTNSIFILDQRRAQMLNPGMSGEIRSRVKQANNVSTATPGLNNSFTQKYISQPNAMISRIQAIVHAALSARLRILNVRSIILINICGKPKRKLIFS